MSSGNIQKQSLLVMISIAIKIRQAYLCFVYILLECSSYERNSN